MEVEGNRARELLPVPDRSTLRDYVTWPAAPCVDRSSPRSMSKSSSCAMATGHWVLADLVGGDVFHTVAVPFGVSRVSMPGIAVAGIKEGRLLRSIHKGGKV